MIGKIQQQVPRLDILDQYRYKSICSVKTTWYKGTFTHSAANFVGWNAHSTRNWIRYRNKAWLSRMSCFTDGPKGSHNLKYKFDIQRLLYVNFSRPWHLKNWFKSDWMTCSSPDFWWHLNQYHQQRKYIFNRLYFCFVAIYWLCRQQCINAAFRLYFVICRLRAHRRHSFE